MQPRLIPPQLPDPRWLKRECEYWQLQLSRTLSPMDQRIADIMYAWRLSQYEHRSQGWNRHKNTEYMQQFTDETEKQLAKHKQAWAEYCAKQDHTHS